MYSIKIATCSIHSECTIGKSAQQLAIENGFALVSLWNMHVVEAYVR